MQDQFGDYLRTLRRQRGLSQRALADSAQISLRTLCYWESGERQPRIPELQSTLLALKVTPEEQSRAALLLSSAHGERLLRQGAVMIGDPIREGGDLPGLGDLLRAMRVRHGWTQEQLAEAVGVTRFAVTRWESTQSFPSEPSLERLCLLLDAYPEEKRALQQRRLSETPWKPEMVLDECMEAVASIIWQIGEKDDRLLDLRILALKRQLHTHLRGDSEEARRQLAILETEHSSWLNYKKRMAEAQTYAKQALNLMQSGLKPELFWTGTFNLAAVYTGCNTARIRFLKQWLNWMPENYLRTFLLCDMALYSRTRPELSASFLRDAERFQEERIESNQYVRLTSARLLLYAGRPVEALGRLLANAATSEERLNYLVMGALTLLAVGERRTAEEYAGYAARELTDRISSSLRQQFDRLTIRLAS